MASRSGFHPGRKPPSAAAAAASMSIASATPAPTTSMVAATPMSAPMLAASIPAASVPSATLMPSVPSKPSVAPNPLAASIGSAHTANILRNFRQEDVVYALMTQLREKESELALLSENRRVDLRQREKIEQGNQQLKNKIDLHVRTMAEKDSKIAVLEQKLAEEMGRKDAESTMAEANVKQLSETNVEYKRIIQERDNELSQLRPIIKQLEAKVDEFETKSDAKLTGEIEEELSKLRGDLAIAKDQQLTSNSTIEELEKKIKGKEWMIKSLQEESDDQRSRENHLLSHIKKLNEKIDAYESKFKGKGVDVPMLLAKLKDYEVRTKDLQSQVRRLTNKKLNELVVRTSPTPHQGKDEDNMKSTTLVTETTSQSQPSHNEDEVDNGSEVSDNYLYIAHSEQDGEEEEATFASVGTDEDGPFSPKSTQDEDVLGDFLTDVKVGIETLEMEGLCCAMRHSPVPTNSPLGSYGSPASLNTHRSPGSYNSSHTFVSGNH